MFDVLAAAKWKIIVSRLLPNKTKTLTWSALGSAIHAAVAPWDWEHATISQTQIQLAKSYAAGTAGMHLLSIAAWKLIVLRAFETVLSPAQRAPTSLALVSASNTPFTCGYLCDAIADAASASVHPSLLARARRSRWRHLVLSCLQWQMRSFELPPWWLEAAQGLVDVTSEQKDRFQAVMLKTSHGRKPGSEDSRCSCFQSSRVVRVWQLWNARRWRQFSLKRSKVQRELVSSGISPKPLQPAIGTALCFAGVNTSINEMFVLHGTSRTNAMNILEEGFNERACVGASYGKGVYFSPQACKSGHHASIGDDGLCCLLVARVVLGSIHYTESHQGSSLRRPPVRSDGKANHSVVANPGEISDYAQLHQEIVLFDGRQSYPEYLVEFERGVS